MLILTNPTIPISHPDYFDVLQISRDADTHTVHAAYHKLAPKQHPSTGDVRKFRLLAEAYTVLSDERLRPVFETFGYIGLHKGVSSPTFVFPGWSFTADPLQIFEDFFGSKQLLLGSDQDVSSEEQRLRRSPDIISELVLSLEAWFQQGVHEVAFVRKTLSRADMRSIVEEQSRVRIDLRRAKNAAVGCRLVFQGEGHWIHPLSVRGDLVVLVKIAKHKSFTVVKDSADLQIDYPILLGQALSGFNAEIVGVDGAVLVVPVWDVVESGKTVRIPGQGLRRPDSPSNRGDLVVTFKVSFPTELSDAQTTAVRHLLRSHH